MTVPETVDVAVIGAGLAGLSFVAWLEQRCRRQGIRPPTVRLVDPRLEYTNDRSWCFWEGAPHPFADAVARRWDSWQVAHGSRLVTRHARSRPYALVPADGLYQLATDCIDRNPEFRLELGTRVERIEPRDAELLIETDHGAIRARSAIDTRPPGISEATARTGLWQVFHGIEIEVATDRFDPSTVTLMDFEADPTEIRFAYVLPLGERRALVELTAFRQNPVVSDLAGRLGERLATVFGHQITRRREEHGMLPMMPIPVPERPDPRIITAGTAGGWMRPATGYLFSACQRGANELARQAIAAPRSGIPRWRTPRSRPRDLDLLDRIFLRAMRNGPGDAPGWFLRLFGGTGADQQARFLSDEPTLLDRLAVIAALPPRPMLRAARECFWERSTRP